METYRIVFDEEKVDGVYAISLVEDPAIDFEFVALSKEKVQLKEVNEEKRLLISPVLIPNQKILRLTDEGVPYNIVFEEDTIRKVQQNFYKKGYQNNSTLEHNENLKLSDVTFVESWIKEDEKLDKSVKYGFSDLPVGTWFAIMKVENDEVWEKVKSGEVKGFSIDGAFELESINLNQIKMSIKKEVFEILQGLGLAKVEEPKQEVKLGSVETENGTLYFEGEELAQGMAVFSDAEMTTAMADGEYKMGENLIVVADGMVSEVKAVEVEAEKEKEEEEVEMSMEQKIQKMFDALGINLAKQVATIQDEVKAIKTELAKVKEVEAVQMTKANPIHETKEPKTLKERMLNNLQNAK
jgi:hypothetical protein